MTLKQFMTVYRDSIDLRISQTVGHVPATASCYCPLSGTSHFHSPKRLNDAERRLWILNDESLYRWARSEGVRI